MSATLRQLAAFVAVVDHGGFGAAADALGMSQSAVSHTLAALERAVGEVLVSRSPGIGTTAVGAAVLPHARATLASARALDAVLAAQRSGAVEGTIRLAAAPTTAHRLVPALLARWRAELPRLDVRLFEGDDDELAAWLDTGTVDCAVLIDPPVVPEGGLTIASDRFQAVLRADHPLASCPSIALGDLLDDPLLVSSSGCEPQIRTLHERAGLVFAPAQRVRSVTTLLGMVEAGLGVTIMPSLAASLLPRELVMVDLTDRLDRQLVFSGPAGRPWHPHVRRMRDIAAAGDPMPGAAGARPTRPAA